MLIFPVTDSVHIEPLVKVTSARPLHCKASLFPLVISEYLAGSFSGNVHILPCSSPNFHSLVKVNMAFTFLKAPQGILMCSRTENPGLEFCPVY